MIKVKDFRGEDNRIDWVAYNAARRAAGEKCILCDRYQYVPLHSPRGPRMCSGCIDLLESSGEVESDTSVRCPRCGHVHDVNGDELYGLYEEGDHEVTCDECDYDFEVTSMVSYEFKSPAMLDGGEE